MMTCPRPYKIAPGTRVRLESAYDGNTRRPGRHGARPSPAFIIAEAFLLVN